MKTRRGPHRQALWLEEYLVTLSRTVKVIAEEFNALHENEEEWRKDRISQDQCMMCGLKIPRTVLMAAIRGISFSDTS